MTEADVGDVSPTRKALLVWYGRYEDPALQARVQVAKDLHDFATMLRGVGEYHEISEFVNQPLNSLQLRVERFFAEAERDDVLFVYLTGEGFKDAQLPDRHFLAVSDTDPTRLAQTAVSADFVRQCMERSSCLNRVLILDFCYSGAFMARLQSREPAALGARTLIVAATSAFEEETSGPGWTSGVLLDVVDRGLRGDADRDGDGLVTATEFADFVLHHARTPLQTATTYQNGPVAELVITSLSQPLPQTIVATAAQETFQVGAVQVTQSEPPDADVDWLTDAPAEQDLLDRRALAELLAERLSRIEDDRPDSSFLMHVDGRWGTGKSTLLRFLRERMEPDFLVVEFDAWRQARLAHPWWSLLTAARDTIAADLRWWRRRLLRLKEIFNRVRRTGAPYVFALVVLLLLALGLAVWLWPRQGTMDQWTAVAKGVGAVVAAMAPFWVGTVVASRFLLWNSARGAKLFEQSGTNPLHEVSAHFSWLLGQARKPVVFFIDDLDRCAHGQVVDLLDTVQTLFRD
ncbi:MAG TPA: P-loop NTPase fold protein, partial [Amycolatopsis sp.]|nr:P-loop NTPase fold protein [Amycolatopsis sp.]